MLRLSHLVNQSGTGARPARLTERRPTHWPSHWTSGTARAATWPAKRKRARIVPLVLASASCSCCSIRARAADSAHSLLSAPLPRQSRARSSLSCWSRSLSSLAMSACFHLTLGGRADRERDRGHPVQPERALKRADQRHFQRDGLALVHQTASLSSVPAWRRPAHVSCRLGVRVRLGLRLAPVVDAVLAVAPAAGGQPRVRVRRAGRVIWLRPAVHLAQVAHQCLAGKRVLDGERLALARLGAVQQRGGDVLVMLGDRVGGHAGVRLRGDDLLRGDGAGPGRRLRSLPARLGLAGGCACAHLGSFLRLRYFRRSGWPRRAGLAVSRDQGLGGLAVSPGHLAALGAGPFRDHGSEDAALNPGDAIGGESGVYLLPDSPAGLRRAALEGRQALRPGQRRGGLRHSGRLRRPRCFLLVAQAVSRPDSALRAVPGGSALVLDLPLGLAVTWPGAGQLPAEPGGPDDLQEPRAAADLVLSQAPGEVQRPVLDLPTVRSGHHWRWSCLVAGQVGGNS